MIKGAVNSEGKGEYRRKAQLDNACAQTPGEPFSDQAALLMRILNDVYGVNGNNRYGDLLKKMAVCFKDRFEPYQGALIWDLDIGNDYAGGSVDDTSHANRQPRTVIDLYESGIVFDKSYVEGLANLLTQVIWDGSFNAPRFTNFIDGSNNAALGRPPWGLGLIYTGWALLGQYDPKVHEVADATLRAILDGKSNPSLDYNATSFGRLSLAGHLAKNIAGQKK